MYVCVCMCTYCLFYICVSVEEQKKANSIKNSCNIKGWEVSNKVELNGAGMTVDPSSINPLKLSLLYRL